MNDTSRSRISSAPERPDDPKVFIGHGRSLVWLALKTFLTERLHIGCDEFNAESAAGIPTTARLEAMLDRALFAFLVMTGEDQHSDGTTHVRENVIHEAGLFQGRLGFQKAIILLEEGCAEFSNVHGLTTIRFPKGNIDPAYEKLEREGVIGPHSGRAPARGPQGVEAESPEILAQREVAECIPYLTEPEREIIGHLLAHNQKMFTNTPDCGRANTLLARGIVVIAARPGQVCSHFEVPFAIPDHIWTVLKQHQKDLPYSPPRRGEAEVHPWRRHWME
jgi:hypothetical protein